MKNIVIIGAGDLGKEVVWLIEDINKHCPTYLILGFLDDDRDKLGGEFYGYKVLGTIEQLEDIRKKTPFSAVVAIQEGSIRRKIVEEHQGFEEWESIIHPTAVIAGTSALGKGSIVFPQATVSVDTKLGDFVLLYIHSMICNDCRIGNYVSIMTGALVSERAIIEDTCFLVAGSCIQPHETVNGKPTAELKPSLKQVD